MNTSSFPDARRSRRLRASATVVAGLALLFGAVSSSGREAAAGPLERRAAETLAGIASKRLGHVKFENADLDAIVTRLRITTGLNFFVRRHVIEKAGIDLASVRSNLDLDDVTLGLVLTVVLEPHGLVAMLDDNVVFITTKADALGPPVFALYDIRHLTWQKTDFHGPELDLLPSGYVAPEGHSQFGGETAVEDDPFLDPQHVVDLLKEMVDATWDAPGWNLTATKHFVAIKAPRAVLRRVVAALDRLAELK
jgi:hypothetical protein